MSVAPSATMSRTLRSLAFSVPSQSQLAGLLHPRLALGRLASRLGPQGTARTMAAAASSQVEQQEQQDSVQAGAAAGAAAASKDGVFQSQAYPFTDIEAKWQAHWEQHKTFRTPEFSELDTTKPKFYALDMFPYPRCAGGGRRRQCVSSLRQPSIVRFAIIQPARTVLRNPLLLIPAPPPACRAVPLPCSGAGLHVGHPEGYTATDILARYKRMRGHNVLHPMGWDAFGLPAEQYAIQTGTHPAATTNANIARFRQQLKSLGFSYDWEREVSTCEPEYYRWTQWIFLQLFGRGLAYQAEVPVNWCPALGTGAWGVAHGRELKVMRGGTAMAAARNVVPPHTAAHSAVLCLSIHLPHASLRLLPPLACLQCWPTTR